VSDDQFEEDQDDGQDWLISYADMMTLIACFFILMMAFANYDPVGFNIKAEKLSKSFRKDKYKSSETQMDKLMEELIEHPEINKLTKISVSSGNLIISFSGSVLFSPGQWKLDDGILPVLDAMIDIIKIKNPDFKVLVTGHADRFNDYKEGGFESKWLLSAARASSVVERFQYFGFNPRNLASLSVGDSQNLVDQKVKESTTDDKKLANRELSADELLPNRRVTIQVLVPRDKNKKVKMGLGAYFNDASMDGNAKENFVDKTYIYEE
jgi:chemotaxis protein MotB